MHAFGGQAVINTKTILVRLASLKQQHTLVCDTGIVCQVVSLHRMWRGLIYYFY